MWVWHNSYMSVICPTITTKEPHVYRDKMESIASFTEGVHLDFSDGIFAPAVLLSIEEAWRSDDLVTHAHIMYQNPLEVVDDIINLEADLVILHAESDNIREALRALQDNGTRTGVALLPETSVADLQELELDGLFDHILVFGGHLGFQGGHADLDQLNKVKRIKETYPDIEIAWDGGVSDENAKRISEAGVAILNVGSYISKAQNPKKAYDTLVSLVS
jgi:ribulose-phosphate 3-epimerase